MYIKTTQKFPKQQNCTSYDILRFVWEVANPATMITCLKHVNTDLSKLFIAVPN